MRKSPHHALVARASSEPLILYRQTMTQQKVWGGIRGFEVEDEYWPYSDTIDADQVRQFIRRYRKRTVDYVGNDVDYEPTAYHMVDDLAGDGNSPTTSGGPAGFDTAARPTGSSSTYNQLPPPTAGGGQGLYRDTYSETHRTWFGGIFGYMVSIDEVLAEEEPFAGHLAVAVNRINERTWPEWMDDPTSWYNNSVGEAFNEAPGEEVYGWQNLPVEDPEIRDLAPDPENGWFEHRPSFSNGAAIQQGPWIPNSYIGSYWEYPIEREFLQSPGNWGTVGYPDLGPKFWIYVVRERFRINKAAGIPYFVATTYIYPEYSSEGNPQLKLWEAVNLIGTGTVSNAGWVDINATLATGYNDMIDLDGGAYLATGVITFVILNETPEDWATRTGFTFI